MDSPNGSLCLSAVVRDPWTASEVLVFRGDQIKRSLSVVVRRCLLVAERATVLLTSRSCTIDYTSSWPAVVVACCSLVTPLPFAKLSSPPYLICRVSSLSRNTLKLSSFSSVAGVGVCAKPSPALFAYKPAGSLASRARYRCFHPVDDVG